MLFYGKTEEEYKNILKTPNSMMSYQYPTADDKLQSQKITAILSDKFDSP